MKKTRTKITNTRRGPFSNKEKKQIADFIESGKSLEELSLILNRSVKQISNYCNGLHLDKPAVALRRTEDEEFTIELHSQADWKMLQKELSQEELAYFEIEYISYRKQLGGLTKTEIKQLHQLIVLDIKIHRHAKDIMKDDKDIDRMERALNRLSENIENNPNSNNQDQMMMNELQAQVQACRTAKTMRNKEHNELIGKHRDILKDLKSTRDQRIKNVEERGKFIVLLKELEVESKRRAISEIVGLMDIAVDKERDRLAGYHRYSDGVIDRPLLNSETIEREELENFNGQV